MNSLGIFHDVKLKNNNNVLFSLKKACDQTSNLVDDMDKYQKPSNFNRNYKSFNLNNININNKRRKNQSVISRIGKNIIINNNSTRLKKKNSEYTNKNTKINKYKNLKNKIFGSINDNNYNYNNYNEQKNNEPYNYNKEYENDLINQIENLFHPSNNSNNIENGNATDIMQGNYMDIFSLMGNEFKLIDKKMNQNNKKSYRNIY